MGFARAADVPVVLLGDIDRGGVIASLVGTQAVIDPADAAMIVGFIVNRFRGDPTLFADGMEDDRARAPAGRRSACCRSSSTRIGCRPRMRSACRRRRRGAGVKIVVLAYPRIANFDDFDPLRLEPGVDLVFLRPGEAIPGDAALVILPGSKATIADLAALRARRLGHRSRGACAARRPGARASAAATRCSAARVADPHGIEGPPSTVDGLGPARGRHAC